MYNNPYLSGFNGLRENQQPIQNIFTSQMPSNNTFMARFLKEGETPQEAFVNTKTALISLNDKKLYIKDPDATIISYGLILPMDEKDKKIEDLENQIIELKEMMNNVSTVKPIETDTSSTEPNGNVKKSNRK